MFIRTQEEKQHQDRVLIKEQIRSQLYVLKGSMITSDVVDPKLKKSDMRPQEVFGEADFFAYGLISVNLDGVDCDQVANSGNSSKFGIEEPDTSLGGVSCDFVGRGNNSK